MLHLRFFGGSRGTRVGHDVFISYARRTSAQVATGLADALAGAGADPFLDTTDIEAGESIPAGVVDALLGARVVVAFVDATYFTRWYCLREFHLAVAAYNTLLRRGAPEPERARALRPVVVVLAETRTGPDELERLPPAIRTTAWPQASATNALVDLVLTHLGEVTRSIGDRLEALGELEALRQVVLGEAALPPPRSLAQIPAYTLPGERRPSIGEAFVGRADELWMIHHTLSTMRGELTGAALTGALEGGGGFGKTRLAAEYLHRFGPPNYRGGLFWVNADLPDRLEEQLHGILATLRPDTPELAIFRDAGRDAARELGAALHELAADPPVLYVVDNVPEPPAGEAPLPISTWCPALGEVALLLTSRHRQSITAGVASLPIDVLEPGPAVELLTRAYPQRHRLTEQAWLAIAEWVGHLPLALELLNASLVTQAVEPEELAASVAGGGPVEVLDEHLEALRGVVPAGSLKGVTEALAISYAKLPDATRLAARLLALLAPGPIPIAILEALGPDVAAPAVRATLTSRSLLMPLVGAEAGVGLIGRMHRVLADFLRAQAGDPAAELLRACQAVGAVMDSDRCGDPASWPLMNACLPHAEALFGAAGSTVSPGKDSAAVALGLEMAVLLFLQGLYARAVEVGTEVVRLASESDELGPDHPSTLTSMNNLALTLQAEGDLPGARDLQEKVLEVFRRLLGPEHPDTLTSMNNLALTLYALGDLLGARQIQEGVLKVRHRILGPEHPQTLVSTDNLAEALRAGGDLPRAKYLQEQALEAQRRILGPEHPDTLTSMNNLALTLHAMGDLPGARKLQEQALAIYRGLLGPEHPDTVTSANNLAGTLHAMGDLPGARSLHEQVLDCRRRILGPEHPSTLVAMGNLAATLSSLGDLAGAWELEKQVLEGRQRVLGPQHASTLTSMSNLAATLSSLGDLAGARDVLEQALESRCRILGPEHPDTLTSMNNLAGTLYALGDLPGARDLEKQVLEGRQRLLGPEHLDSTTSAWNLLVTLRDLHAHTEAQLILDNHLAWLLQADPNRLTGSQRQIAQMVSDLAESDRRKARRRGMAGILHRIRDG